MYHDKYLKYKAKYNLLKNIYNAIGGRKDDKKVDGKNIKMVVSDAHRILIHRYSSMTLEELSAEKNRLKSAPTTEANELNTKNSLFVIETIENVKRNL